MFKQRLLAGLAAGSLIVGFSATVANAVDQDVGATLDARAALTAVLNSDMDFGIVEYGAGHTGTIELGTDGAVAITGATNLAPGAGSTPAAGSVTITGDTGALVNIRCETGGTLDDGAAGAAMTLAATEIVVGAGLPFDDGGASDCAGLGADAIASQALTGGSITILMGGSIAIGVDAITASGVYNTTGGNGGTPVQLTVNYI